MFVTSFGMDFNAEAAECMGEWKVEFFALRPPLRTPR
jgi:hypothetical protein